MAEVRENNQILQVVNEIMDLFEKHGPESYFGEQVSQHQHAVQAATLAEESGAEDELILAAFLHDIGHLCVSEEKLHHMADFGVLKHEQVAGSFLKSRGFSKRIVQLVESHVDAKRYLVFSDPQYYTSLSDASKQTLEYQGGPMEPEEAKKFEKQAHFKDAIQLRQWDEQAKDPNQPVRDMDKHRELCLQHLITHKWYQKIGFIFF